MIAVDDRCNPRSCGRLLLGFLSHAGTSDRIGSQRGVRLGEIDRWLAELQGSGQFNGGVLIAREGEPLLIKTYGYADAAGKRPLTDKTPFRLASVSKQFTAAAILRLVEKGQLKLDDPAGDHLQDFPFSKVKVRHLLNQTSGIPDVYMDLAEKHREDFGESLRIKDVVALISRYPPEVKSPGDEFLYSNTNYVLLAGLIESVSDKSYENFMRQELFEPLGMHQTRVWNRVSSDQEFPERAEDFQAFAGDRQPLQMTWIDGVAGDGAVFCSLKDFLIWDEFWNGNSLISDELLAEALMRPTLNEGESSDYGFGWVISGRSRGRFWHNGRWLGAATFIMRDDQSKTCLVVLDNSLNLRMDTNAATLQDQVLGLGQSSPEEVDATDSSKIPPRLSPFTDIQFEKDLVMVTYDGQLYEWLELNGIKVDDIVASAKMQFGERWQMRISEDLVEVLWGMDHQPEETVKPTIEKPQDQATVGVRRCANDRGKSPSDLCQATVAGISSSTVDHGVARRVDCRTSQNELANKLITIRFPTH